MRTAVIVVCFICPNCLSLRDNAACCIPLRDLRYLRENIHPNLLNQYTQTKPQCLPQISLIYADKTPKQQNILYLNRNCLSLRYNAACCIPLRDLRYLRENIHARVLKLSAQKKPQYLPLIPQIYADNPQNNINHKTTKQHQPHAPYLSTIQRLTRTGIH